MDKAVTVKFNGGREGEFDCLMRKEDASEFEINILIS
jgi:hypothetical protein